MSSTGLTGGGQELVQATPTGAVPVDVPGEGGAMASLQEQIFRRKPVVEMELETGADTGRSEPDPRNG